jgi:hypothetical protein
VAEVFMPPAANISVSRRFAYAMIDPPAASPGFLLCRAFEECASNPYVGLVESDYGTLMVFFASPKVREPTMPLFPLTFDGHKIRLERPEEEADWFAWYFSHFA